MVRQTIALCCVTAALALAGCAGGQQPSDAETESPAAAQAAPDTPDAAVEQLGESSQPTEFPARVGLLRVEDEAKRVAHEYTRQFYDGELAALYERFSDEFKTKMTLDQLSELRQSVREELGDEIEIISEELQEKDGYVGFARWARFEKHDGLIQVHWILRDDDVIAGFWVRPAQRPAG